MADYQPTIAQACFGQPWKECACPPILEAALEMIRHEIIRVVGNRTGEWDFDPGANHNEAFRCGDLGMWAYDWADPDYRVQPYNFIHIKSGLRVSFYKYMGRGMSCDRDVSPDLAAEVLRDCLAALERVDDGATFQHGRVGDVPYFEVT